jgi:transcriptional regulator with XRE-family HTH domain
MGQLWDIVQTHIDSAPYPPSLRQVAARLGVTATTLGNWRDPQDLPARKNLRALAELTGTPYLKVLEAALTDTGYVTASEATAIGESESGNRQREAG